MWNLFPLSFSLSLKYTLSVYRDSWQPQAQDSVDCHTRGTLYVRIVNELKLTERLRVCLVGWLVVWRNLELLLYIRRSLHIRHRNFN